MFVPDGPFCSVRRHCRRQATRAEDRIERSNRRPRPVSGRRP